jgi:acetyltransferase-like isoleucine patch superfamily enzyme
VRRALVRRTRRSLGAAIWWALEPTLLTRPRFWGPADRLHLDPSALLCDALLNTTSGHITIGPDVFFGHGCAVLAATHDVEAAGPDRRSAVPDAGRDIVIGEGAWIASGAIVLGPCTIGAHAVVAAGAVVTGDVPAGVVAGGIPARVLRAAV